MSTKGYSKRIVVVGPTGVGKSRLVEAFAHITASCTYPEPNPSGFNHGGTFFDYVEAMGNSGPNPLALPFQMWMASETFQQFSQILSQDPGELAIWEVGPFGHFMYAMKLAAEGRILPEEFQTYCIFFFSELVKTLPPDAVLVCMVRGVDELLARIRTRYQGDSTRAAEAHYPRQYLEDMILYWETLLRFGVVLPVTELLSSLNGSGEPSLTIEGKPVPFLSVKNILAQQPELLAKVVRYFDLLRRTTIVVVNGSKDWTTTDGEFNKPDGLRFVKQLLNIAV